jgi:hypothetical protein
MVRVLRRGLLVERGAARVREEVRAWIGGRGRSSRGSLLLGGWRKVVEREAVMRRAQRHVDNGVWKSRELEGSSRRLKLMAAAL